MAEEQYLSAAEVAKVVGVHYRTIENWKAQEKIESQGGKYGLLSAVKYRIEDLGSQLDEFEKNPKLALNLQKLKHEVNKEEAIARIKNLEVEEKEGQLVRAEDVEQVWNDLIANCKAKFLALPTKVALQLSGISDPEEIQSILKRLFDQALEELSDD